MMECNFLMEFCLKIALRKKNLISKPDETDHLIVLFSLIANISTNIWNTSHVFFLTNFRPSGGNTHLIENSVREVLISAIRKLRYKTVSHFFTSLFFCVFGRVLIFRHARRYLRYQWITRQMRECLRATTICQGSSHYFLPKATRRDAVPLIYQGKRDRNFPNTITSCYITRK